MNVKHEKIWESLRYKRKQAKFYVRERTIYCIRHPWSLPGSRHYHHCHPVGPKGRLYYELHPYNQKDGKIVTPVDSEKTITRLLLTRPEAEALIQEIPQIKEMTVANDKQREERYKEALKTCDCRVWVSMIKALYLRKQDRIEHKKKVTDLDERYFRMAEDYLNSELSLALDISKEKINEYIKERIVV